MSEGLLELKLRNYLRKLYNHEVAIPDELATDMAEGLRKNFTTLREQANDGEFTLRMSSLGHPICQQTMERNGAEKVPAAGYPPEVDVVKFATGDMLEHWLLMVLRAADLGVEDWDVSVETEISGEKIKGTLDIIINGGVWDIKTASDYSFKKFSEFGGFADVEGADAFGYVTQGFLYSKATGLPFRGWIVINKNNGQIAFCKVPDYYHKFADAALKQAEDSVRAKMENWPFERCFEDVPETFRKKETGNRILEYPCTFCPYRYACWPGLEHRPAVMSSAKDPKKVYYTELNYIPDEEKG